MSNTKVLVPAPAPPHPHSVTPPRQGLHLTEGIAIFLFDLPTQELLLLPALLAIVLVVMKKIQSQHHGF